MTLETIVIPDEFLDLCTEWAGESSCKFRAISNAGSLTLGNRRPYSIDVERYLTDEEWHVRLYAELGSDARYYARLAEKGGHIDAESLRRFEEWADQTSDRLRTVYHLEDSEAV